MASCVALAVLGIAPVQAQHERGEIHLQVRDQQGGALVASVKLASEANHVDRTFLTSNGGSYVARELPYGLYRLEVTYPGFVPFSKLVTVQSEVPVTVSVTLGLAPVKSSINVTD